MVVELWLVLEVYKFSKYYKINKKDDKKLTFIL